MESQRRAQAQTRIATAGSYALTLLLVLTTLLTPACTTPSSPSDSPTPPTPPYAGPDQSILGTITTDAGDRVDVSGRQIYNAFDAASPLQGDAVLEGLMLSFSPMGLYYAYGEFDAVDGVATFTQTVGSVVDGPRGEDRTSVYFGDVGFFAGSRQVYYALARNAAFSYAKLGGFNGGGRGVGGPFGVSTAPADMPDDGDFTVSAANVDLTSRQSPTHGTQVSSAAAVDFDADFAAGTVDFRVTPSSGTWPFDYVEARGLEITGNAFTGGTVDAYQELSGGLVLRAFFLGTPAQQIDNLAGGIFFGPPDPLPAEVGVAVLITTETGAEVTVSFVATRAD